MVNLIRKYQQPALIGITILVIVTFIWFWNGPTGHGGIGGSSQVASIYGQRIMDVDVKRAVGKFQIAMALGMSDLVQGLAGNAEDQQHALENFVFNSYVFDHEADALQIYPTDAEVQDELARIPGFQTDGRFDPNKLTEFVQEKLPSVGFSDSVIDDLVRQQVRLHKVSELIGATVQMTPAEKANRFESENEMLDASVVRLDTSSVEKAIPVSDADVQKAYDQHKETYRSDEQRKVDIASFELSAAQKDLKGKERTDALQKLGNQAWALAQAVVEKGSDFSAQSKKFGAQLGSSAFFTATQPDPALTKIPTLATNAFRLSSDYPSSDVLEGQNGYYILHLAGSVPSKQLSFAEAKPKIVAQIQTERAAQLMQTKAAEVRNRIIAGLKAGKSFTDAAKEAGLTAQEIPAFSLQHASRLDVPDARSIISTAVGLSAGQLSDFVQTEAGGLLVYLKDRQPPEMTAYVEEAAMKKQLAQQERAAAFFEWMRLRREAARLQIVQR
jgi:hypothetical protein